MRLEQTKYINLFLYKRSIKMNLIILNNIEIEVTKKKIKNLHLSVMPPNGTVKISAPLEVTDDAIIAFASSKLTWIKNQISIFRNHERESKREFVSGESFYLFGKRYLLNIEVSNKNKLEIINDRAKLYLRENISDEQRVHFVLNWYRKELRKCLASLIYNWQNKTNLVLSSWQIKDMKTKWGSCTKNKAKLWFNLQLVKKPIDCIEYVVLHELVHLRVEKHNNEFKSIMQLYMPDWQERKDALNNFILDYIN